MTRGDKIFEVCEWAFLVACFVVVMSSFGFVRSQTTQGDAYSRDDFGRWDDCTRAEVILSWATEAEQDGCEVGEVLLQDPYSGETVRVYSSEIDVDHVVPLREAWYSGLAREDYERFANDGLNLIPTTRHENRSKGSRGPEEWLPSDPEARCWYIALWSAVKGEYELEVDSREFVAIHQVRRACAAR